MIKDYTPTAYINRRLDDAIARLDALIEKQKKDTARQILVAMQGMSYQAAARLTQAKEALEDANSKRADDTQELLREVLRLLKSERTFTGTSVPVATEVNLIL